MAESTTKDGSSSSSGSSSRNSTKPSTSAPAPASSKSSASARKAKLAAEKLSVKAVAAAIAKPLLSTKGVHKLAIGNDPSNKTGHVFKGKHIVRALLASKAAGLDRITTREAAVRLAKRLLLHKDFFVFVPCAVVNPAAPTLTFNLMAPKSFKEDAFYVWRFKGSQTFMRMMLLLVVVVFFGCTLFPLWPKSMKLGVFYLCLGLLVFIIGSLLLRLVVFAVFWLIGLEVWILPNVFAEDEVDTWAQVFQPMSFGKAPPGQWLLRMLFLIAIGAIAYLIVTQPTEFDHFVQANRAFVENIYTGAFLNDKSAEDVDNMDNTNYKRTRPNFGLDADDIFGKPEPAPQADGFDDDGVFDYNAGLDQFMDDDVEEDEEL